MTTATETTNKGDEIMTIIIRSPDGKGRREVELSQVQVPDAWHLAMRLPQKDQDIVLELWHLCHALKRHITENES